MKTKTNILRVVLTLFVLTLSTATLYALCKTGEKPTTTPEPTSAATTSSTQSGGYLNGHEWVDLGLSVKWATCNIGASSPGDYGNYYAWGEVRPKSEYTFENSITNNRNTGSISGNPAFDAARANWGGSWRLPTINEVNELLSKCTRTSSMQGDHFGYIFTGPNGNSIFLPATGSCWKTEVNNQGIDGDYWTGTPQPDWHNCAYVLTLSTGVYYHNYLHRAYGQAIRPVTN